MGVYRSCQERTCQTQDVHSYNDSDSSSDEEGCEPDTVTDICFAMGELKDGDWTSLDAMLDDVRRKRPKFQFAEGHVERKTHFQMVVLLKVEGSLFHWGCRSLDVTMKKCILDIAD